MFYLLPNMIEKVGAVVVLCWIYYYLCNQCLPLLKLSVRTPFMVRITRYNIM